MRLKGIDGGKGFKILVVMLVLVISPFLTASPGISVAQISPIGIGDGQRDNGSGNGTPAQYDLGFNMTEYHGYDEITGMLENLTLKHGDIMRMYPLATTVEDRTIWGVKVSKDPDLEDDSKPEVLFIGLHHAREWSSVEVVMYTLYFLVENYGKPPTDNDKDGKVNEDPFNGIDDDGDGRIDEDGPEARATWLVDNRQLWFIPILNPDGLEFCRKQYFDEGIRDEATLWRKNREPNVNPVTGDPYPEYVGNQPMWGTDLNRNYGWHWGEIGYQGYVDPSREDYAGHYDTKDDDGDRKIAEDNMDGVDNDRDGLIDEDPRGGFSTVETSTVRKILEEHNFVSLVSYHTYKEFGEIYWGNMYTRQLPPDEQTFKHLAEGMHAFNGYDYRNYTEQDRHRKGPLVDGDLNDYAYGALGIWAFCIELRQPQFIADLSLLPQLEGENLGANLYMAEVADAVWGDKFQIDHIPLKDTDDTRGPYTVRARLNVTSQGSPPQLMSHGITLRYSVNGGADWSESELVLRPDGNWEADIPGQDMGTKVLYYIEADATNGARSFSPSYAPAEAHMFYVGKGHGNTSPVLLALHIVLMIGAIILLVPGAFLEILYLKNKQAKYAHRGLEIAGIFSGMFFIGGFPLGWIVAYQEFGVPWTGIPFGWDITDNKTLIIMVYWVIALLLVKGTLMRTLIFGKARFCPFKVLLKGIGRFSKGFDGWLRKERKDLVTQAGFAKLFIVGTLITIGLFLIPHSIRI